MSEPEIAAVADISEPLTWRQICDRHPDEWVALVEVEWVNETDFDFRSARVAGHGKRRKDPMVQAASLWARYHKIGHFYTGRVRAPLAPLFFA
jgi:hypothetical protein